MSATGESYPSPPESISNTPNSLLSATEVRPKTPPSTWTPLPHVPVTPTTPRTSTFLEGQETLPASPAPRPNNLNKRKQTRTSADVATKRRRRQSPVRRPSLNTSGRNAPYPFALESLLAAGTIILESHCVTSTISDCDEHRAASVSHTCRDQQEQWRPLTQSSLSYLEPETPLPPPTPSNDDDPQLTPLPPCSPSPENTPSTPSPKKKRKRSLTKPIKPKKERSEAELLNELLSLQDALLLRATYKRRCSCPVTLSQEHDACIVVRIYLVPRDLPELVLGDVQKTSRGRPSVSTVVRVLSSIRRDLHEWNTGETRDSVAPVPTLFDDQDHRSLLEIYRDLQSPPDDPTYYFNLPDASDSIRDRLCDSLSNSPVGFQTELYPYQKASVTKMLARELAPQLVHDPSFAPCLTVDGKQSFHLSVSGSVALEPKKFREPRGGILAENMGTGKTCISLALIMSTLHALPDLSHASSFLDHSPSPPPFVLTPTSESFPFTAYREEINRLRRRVPSPINGWDPSIKEINTYFEALRQQEELEAAEPRKPIPSLHSITLAKWRTTSGSGLTSIDSLRDHYRERILSETPFYYVHPSPAQLATRKGRDGHYKPVKVVVSPATLVVVPTDLVPQWRDEIEKHVDPNAGLRTLVVRMARDPIPSPDALANYDIVLMSVSRFSREAEEGDSALKQVHWKRLLVDEGHALGSDNRMRKLAEELRTECAWGISGTPTKNLRGEEEGALLTVNVTSAGDEVDLQRLGQIFTRFLKHPFFSKVEDWRSTFIVPILHENQGVSRLARVLDRVIVRNKREKIDTSYSLPPLTSEVIYLDLKPSELKMHNALLAVFTSNMVTSQRKDQDYFFSPQNKKYLDELTLNLSASTFFFSSEGILSAFLSGIKNSEESLASPSSEAWSASDREALAEAIDRMKTVTDDVEWRHTSASLSIAMEVRNIDKELVQAFCGLDKDLNPRQRTLLSLGQLVTFRRHLNEARKAAVSPAALLDDDDLKEEIITLETKRRAEALSNGSKASSSTQASSLSSLQSPATSIQLNLKRTREASGATTTSSIPTKLLTPLPVKSCFREIELGMSTSSKLNHCVSEVRKHPDEKFIIFCTSLPDLLFANLSEAFDLLGIRHLIFAGSSRGKGSKDRGALAAKFNSTPPSVYQVILVDARLGGRGLNLTAASRMIMLEPIWLPDLEVQAVKRAHRLGQTKPVHLQVLVIRNSYEHDMLERRAQLSKTAVKTAKQPQGDDHIRHLLQSARYIDYGDAVDVDVNVDEGAPTQKVDDDVVWTSLVQDGGASPNANADERGGA